MFRPPSNSNNSNASKSKQTNHGTTSPTIREIKSRTSPATNSRQLLVNRRQAMSTEKLDRRSPPTRLGSADKGSPGSSSNTSINGSPVRSLTVGNQPSSTSPAGSSANGGLNRTASRVSRFRSAKAVFERLSSTNNGPNSRPEKLPAPERPRGGTVLSRYAAAAAARATSAANSSVPSSPRSRAQASRSLSDVNKSSVFSQTKQPDSSQPRPQPRVLTNRSNSSTDANSASRVKSTIVSTTTTTPSPTPMTAISSSKTTTTNSTISSGTSKGLPSSSQAKPPPKDLLDKIVLEIAKNGAIDPDCTIQDLSNCDISNLPDALDFEDVEMMTEEEARKLLSRKHSSSSPSASPSAASSEQDPISVEQQVKKEIVDPSSSLSMLQDSPAQKSPESQPSTTKSRVRFSEDPVQVCDTHAVEDYDRRNDDIDPVAASAEYELEKSKERQGIKSNSDDEEEEEGDNEDANDESAAQIVGPVQAALSKFPSQSKNYSFNSFGVALGATQMAHNSNVPAQVGGGADFGGDLTTTMTIIRSSSDSSHQQVRSETCAVDQPNYADKDYVESLEREANLKRILEQNLRDLQSQYYEAVRELDDFKGKSQQTCESLHTQVADLKHRLDTKQGELDDTQDKSRRLEQELNDIKESSQTLEKKYHRAKKIIKDMQAREQSFARREQLYQQKLDEIEYELGILIESIDRTVLDDGLRYYSLLDAPSCQTAHQAKLDVFGLVKQMLNNFGANQSTQNPQIKQRVITILEQQLAELMVSLNGQAAITANLVSSTKSSGQTRNSLGDVNNRRPSAEVDNKPSQDTYQTSNSYASHRLSQPNLPHPVGVGGQPTKLFHGFNPIPAYVPANEPSPPQSVNSYPSSNSLNSLNNNNNTQSLNNNNLISMQNKLTSSDLLQTPTNTAQPPTNQVTPAPTTLPGDLRASFTTNEWHDKPVSEWTTTQVSTWLLALGLDQYISKFEDRNVNGQSLINLDSTVLKGLGVLNSNDRNLLKKKIRELRVEMEKERKNIEKKMKENLRDKSKKNKSWI